MRNVWILISCFLLPLLTVTAQPTIPQPPIIAEYDDKWYAVSPLDGSASLLLEPDADKKLLHLMRKFISPDHQWLAYVQYVPMAVAKDAYPYELYLLNLNTREKVAVKPSGGIFDRPLPPNRVIRISMPTWSHDSSRLYYLREEYDTRNGLIILSSQLAYYDLDKNVHRLLSRIDHSRMVDDLSVVKDGVILRTVKGGSEIADITYYAANGSVINHSQWSYTHQTPVVLEGNPYYVELGESEEITELIDSQTEVYTKITDLYFPAFRSMSADDNSLRVFRVRGSSFYYHIYAADHTTLLKVVSTKLGVKLAISPDGQTVAFLPYDKVGEGFLSIIEADGSVRELPFRANLIVWGALENEAFAVLDPAFSLNG